MFISNLFLVLFLFGCNNLNAEQEVVATYSALLGDPFQLQLGDTAVFDSVDITITFNELTEDSRCPISTTDATLNCFWEGQVQAEFVYREANNTEIDVRFVGFVQEGAPALEWDLGDFSLFLERVDPYPTHPDPSTDPIVATLRLERTGE